MPFSKSEIPVDNEVRSQDRIGDGMPSKVTYVEVGGARAGARGEVAISQVVHRFDVAITLASPKFLRKYWYVLRMVSIYIQTERGRAGEFYSS